MRPFLLVLATMIAACTPKSADRGAGAEAGSSVDSGKGARHVNIVRDDWGIPHVHGRTDADAVFGLIYAQAEDDFNRIETNYLNAMGRLAEAEGESAIFRDLRMKLFIDPDDLKTKYEGSPDWLKALMNAWAEGMNLFLAKNPQASPRVIKHFEPWMALSFSEGSIGGDIERIALPALEALYGKGPVTDVPQKAREKSFVPDGGGSNGFAIAPSRSTSGHALLLINPHTSFFFRAEVQVKSDEGLNAYGAVTWGQFFVYQGFNERAGWMHTSSGVDCIDEYAESVVKKDDGFYYRYDGDERKVAAKTITIPYKTDAGMQTKAFTVFRTHHGPIVRVANQQWISVRLMEEPVKALMQSYSRTKAKNYGEFKRIMDLHHTNSSNNTVFADAEGNIAYFHGNFIPKRDARFDWSKPVDGSTGATEWQAVMSVDESPHVHNPSVGWIQNTNNWPFSAAGPESPKQTDYPRYVETFGENPRGVHAVQVLDARSDFTLSSLTTAAFDSYLTAFDPLLTVLFADYDRTSNESALKTKLSEQVAMLKAWDRRWSVTSIATSLAYFWGEELWRLATAQGDLGGLSTYDYMAKKMTAVQRLEALNAMSDKLQRDFGSWKTPWGEINRFQRLTGDIVQPFDDAGPSIPVGFASGRWGSLASFSARSFNGSKKIYGTSGNSFVAVVEFGDKVKARAITAGGQSGHPASAHFKDQAARYAIGDLRDVYFYPAELEGHIERQYQPGN
jgi:acyl-homoserine-lactone acylase